MPDTSTQLRRSGLTRMLERFRALGAAGPLAIAVTVLPTLGGLVLAGAAAAVAPQIRQHYALGMVLHCLIFSILGGLALAPTYVNTAVGGWTFGFAGGFFVVWISLGASSLLMYVLARRLSGGRITQLIAANPKAAAVHEMLIGRGFLRATGIVTLVRIPPGLPYAVTNVVMAAAGVPLPAYAMGTLIGLIPRTLVGTYMFSRLEKLDFSSSHQLADLAIRFAGAGLVLLILSYLARRALARAK